MSEENEESFDPEMDAEAEMAKAMAEAEAAEVPAAPPAPATIGVMPASETDQPMDGSLDRILDIPLVISAQLGSAKMLIKELLQLGPGSVVELDKLAGEPLEVLVNEKLVARGEVVMVNEKFGIRLTDVVSQTERVNNLS
ncbi:MAG: hypothetical protein NPIRA05_14090 [Nitrospirales bacterium]|nr:MAG: hypothetical protein NPIRA05_14090 [Nitrospirales bacterium]